MKLNGVQAMHILPLTASSHFAGPHQGVGQAIPGAHAGVVWNRVPRSCCQGVLPPCFVGFEGSSRLHSLACL